MNVTSVVKKKSTINSSYSKIIALKKSGKTSSFIANYLNDNGFKTTRGKLWTSSKVSLFLYKTKQGLSTFKTTPEPMTLVSKDLIKAIITDANLSDTKMVQLISTYVID